MGRWRLHHSRIQRLDGKFSKTKMLIGMTGPVSRERSPEAWISNRSTELEPSKLEPDSLVFVWGLPNNVELRLSSSGACRARRAKVRPKLP